MFVKNLVMEKIKPREILQSFLKCEVSSNSDFKIKGKSVEGPLLLIDQSYDFNITFENCSFDYIYIHNTVSKKNIRFQNCTFLDDFLVRGLRSWSLKFEDCIFEKRIELDYCDSTFLDFIKTESKNGITLSSGQINRMLIDPLNEKTHFALTGIFLLVRTLSVKSISGVTIFSKKCIVNKIYLSGYFNIGSRLDFSNIMSVDVKIDDLNNDGKIYFSNIKQCAVKEFVDNPITNYLDDFSKSNYKYREEEIEHIKSITDNRTIIELIATEYSLSDFTQYIEERFSDFLRYEEISTARLNISNSSVGILEIKNMNFDWNYNINIQNSDLSSIKLINSKIPDIKVSDDYLNYYNVYNDLYTSASKQNNSKDKIDYYRISQRYLYKFLKHEALSKDRDSGSIGAIFISNMFSSHGTNWLKAIIVTIVFSFIFFCLFMASLNGVYVDLSWRGCAFAGNSLLTYLPQFINPLHKLDFMTDFAKLGTWSALVDLFSRVVVAVGLFETVRSFRKHVRQ